MPAISSTRLPKMPWYDRLWIVNSVAMRLKRSSSRYRVLSQFGMMAVCQSWQCSTSGVQPRYGSISSAAREKKTKRSSSSG
jgi:hypothetical protein